MPITPTSVDRRVLGERALDLERADVRAVVDDDLLLAAEEPEVAVVVGAGEVAGVEPAVAHDLGGRVGVAPVADGLAAGLDPHPADVAGRDLGAVVVEQRDRRRPGSAGRSSRAWISPDGGFSVASPTSVMP